MTHNDIELLKKKNEIAFDKFYDKYHKLFFSIIYKIVKDFASTEDLVSETFCKIVEDISQYNGGNFKYWCLTIAKNIAYMHLRKVVQERKKVHKYIEYKTLEEDSERNEDIKELI